MAGVGCQWCLLLLFVCAMLFLDRWTYRAEVERVDLDTEGGDVLLLELASQVTLDEGGLR